jgi:hypothetical protein
MTNEENKATEAASERGSAELNDWLGIHSRVMVYKNERVNGNIVKTPRCVAIFHQFTQDHVEYDSGPGPYPAAIIELQDGTLESIHVELLRFLDADGV